jgi:sulfate permease, SulP family
VPIVSWFRGYRTSWLGRDALAGATTAAVVIPQAMAYATVAGLPLQHGLYCALVPMAVYALLGTSRPLSVSTTSTISLLTAAAIASAPQGAEPASVAALLALEVGALLLVAGVLRLGFVSDFISRPVLAGFKVGMGLTIAASQLGKVLGVPVTGDTFFPKVASALRGIGEISVPTLLIAAASVVVLIGLRRLWPPVPGPLVVLVGGMALVAATAIEAQGVATVPSVPGGLPAPSLPSLDLATSLLPASAGIALMAFVESIAAARAFRGPKDPPLRPDRELIALGAASVGAGLFRAYPTGGGLSQTAVNDRAGATTPLSQIVTAGLVALVLIALYPLFRYVPDAVLGAIVLVAAANLLAREEARAIRTQRIRDWAFGIVTLVAVLLLGTLQGILVGVVASVLGLFWDLNHPPVVLLGRRPGTDRFRSLASHPADETVPGLLIARIESPLYFGNAQRVLDGLAQIVQEEDPRPRVLLLDMSAVSDADTTAAAVLAERSERLGSMGVDLWLAGMTDKVLELARRGPSWARLEHDGRVHPSISSAIRSFQARGDKRPNAPSPG